MREFIYPDVPAELKFIQEFLEDTLLEEYYKKQSMRNLGLALIKFFGSWPIGDKERYKVRACTEGDSGFIEVKYKDTDEDYIILIIKQES